MFSLVIYVQCIYLMEKYIKGFVLQENSLKLKNL